MATQKKDSNTEVIYASIGLVGMGVLFSTLGSPLIAIGLCSLGSATTVYYLYDSMHCAKEKEIFRKCGLMADNKYPEILHKDKTHLKVKIPVGLSFATFSAKKDVLEVAFNCAIELESIPHNKLLIHFKNDVHLAS